MHMRYNRGMTSLIITIDGPAGVGKSTVAHAMAHRLGLSFLDTGAMYRGITARCLDKGIDPVTDPDGLVKTARSAVFDFDWDKDPPHMKVDGRNLTHRLRDADVTQRVSPVAANGDVRQVLVEAQRRISRQRPRVVTEGRDQGSAVFPDAPVKFFLDASPLVRAKRRVQQLRAANRKADQEVVLAQLRERDTRDSTRTDGPLVCPADAQRVDTTQLSLNEVIDLLERRVRETVGEATLTPAAAAEAR